MSRTVSRAGVLAVVVGLVAALVVLLPTAPAEAASKGRVRGYIATAGSDHPPLKVSWFTSDWQYLGSRSVSRSGGYGLALKPGTYRLQFSDKRPSYDVTKLASADTTVTVRAGSTTVRNVRMTRGAAITGTVRAGGQAGRHATVIAASADRRSFSTVANDKGQFAIGGLPAGSYSVFTYDHGKKYVGKSVYVRKLKPGHPQNLGIHLTKKAGSLIVDLYAGREAIDKTLVVTAISKQTGQFWTVKAKHGTVVLHGVYPGRYQLIVPGYGDFLARTGNVARGVVRAGRPAFGSFRLTQRGGAFTGRLLTGDDDEPVGKATVRIYDTAGAIVAETTTANDGTFRVGGRLGTMKTASLVAFAGSEMDYYDVLRVRGLSIKVNQTKDLGDLVLPAKPSATVVGEVVDASNTAISFAHATVQLTNAKGTVIGSTTSATDGSFTIDKHLLSQSGVSVVVTPAGNNVTLDGTTYSCQYVASTHGGIVLEAGATRDLGLVGVARKTGGTCNAPLGDGVVR
ncbi:carboxypeptidase-like regulatory domain-containing protein [Nocardioides mangrovi]|uniref:Carboxypeptidase-like regulatory domain-containing protein n=1 Tax=Nocardioides mangrovi TaxID=2874580 RepID=A0ABS7UCU0_9ACTN|nr:carboxypeptidase-like regulatory domain-containing protein [Nocardioides mangrovi]MBZ5738659.1 carboxypeptidase-like regulatory domain-containing protein [Nocardioides mangrovi]